MKMSSLRRGTGNEYAEDKVIGNEAFFFTTDQTHLKIHAPLSHPRPRPILVTVFGKSEMALNSLQSHFLQLPLIHISSYSTSSSTCANYSSNQPRLPQAAPLTISMTRISRDSTRPRKKSSPTNDKSEAQGLVRLIIRRFSDKEPLLKTLSRHEKVVRNEHCFLLFDELGKNDKWLECLEVYRWMQKQRWCFVNNSVYAKLISVMGKKGQTRMAMWLFTEMRNSGCRPDTSVYNALITAHLHSRDKTKALAKALGYFEKMKGIDRCKPNVVTYNILLRAFAQAGNVDQVNSLFKDLDASFVSPDILTFNGVMDAYGKNGMIWEMESVLSRMKSNRFKPDIITFNLLIDSYGKRQEFDKMEQVYRSLLHSNLKPTLPTFNSMILNYGKARLREKAEHVYKSMKDMGYRPSFITYESLIYMYGLCDCVSKAQELFDGLVESKDQINVSTLNAMLEVYCMNGLPMEADVLFERASSIRVLPDSSTYKLLYKAYTKANMKELLGKLLKRMGKDGIVPNKRFFLNALGTIGSLPASSGSKSATAGSSGFRDFAKSS